MQVGNFELEGLDGGGLGGELRTEVVLRGRSVGDAAVMLGRLALELRVLALEAGDLGPLRGC